MASKHDRTLQEIFENPVRASIPWKAIISMRSSFGVDITEAAGSRVAIELNGAEAVFHRPHPQKETDKGAVKSMRRFLLEAGITPRSRGLEQ